MLCFSLWSYCYSLAIRNSEKAINALYAIDPKSNGGKNFPYDEVVRKKDERRKMHAGDCECCQEVIQSSRLEKSYLTFEKKVL